MNRLSRINILIMFISIFIDGCNSNSNSTSRYELSDIVTDSNQLVLNSSKQLDLKGTISSYFNSEDIVLVSGPVMEANRIVYYNLGEDVFGYYGWASQGEIEYYFVGKLKNNKIIGKKYSLSDKSKSDFQLTIANNKVLTMSPSGAVKLTLNNDDLFNGKRNTIYKYPDINSSIIKPDYELERKGFSLIEIGNLDKSKNEYVPYNIWYKVKNENFEGWVLGLLSVF